ncbi:MAG TPA: VWA-like domain-containing protein [Vicinamibacterales bacterium]|nr:VWA-like domain-containing protein [Vicinamibacterales bacterium]
MIGRLAELIRGLERKDGYSRALQAARVRAAYQRAYFAPALFNLIPVRTDLVAAMAVDTRWRLYYNEEWVKAHSVEETAAVLIHEVSHLLREHDARRHAAAVKNERLWNTAADCEINDDLLGEDLPLPDNPPTPERYGLTNGENAETYYRKLLKPRHDGDGHHDADTEALMCPDCGSGAHGEARPWEVPDDDGSPGGVAGVDPVKAKLVQREVAHQILDRTGDAGDAPLGWKRWAQTVLAPKVDFMATIRHVVRKALHDSTIGRSDRTYRRPHRRQAAYGEFLMPSFHQPRPRPGFLIDTSSSMHDTQLSRAVTELGGLTRQLGYGADVIVACCDVVVHEVKPVFSVAQLELIGGGGTNVGAGIEWFVKCAAIDLLVIVSDCQTPWPAAAPPFPVITIRVGDGPPPPWGGEGHNQVITIDET